MTDFPSSPVTETPDIEYLKDYGENGYGNMTAGEAYKKGFANGVAKLAASQDLVSAELGRWCYENPNLAAMTIEGLRGHSPDRIQKLEQEVAKLRAFAESFHVTVVDNFYKDVTLVLEQPHTLAIRLQNDSTKSWIFADLEDRRKAALADTSTPGNSK